MRKNTRRRIDMRTLIVRIVALICAAVIVGSALIGIFF
jgi:hypothetical protein